MEMHTETSPTVKKEFKKSFDKDVEELEFSLLYKLVPVHWGKNV